MMFLWLRSHKGAEHAMELGLSKGEGCKYTCALSASSRGCHIMRPAPPPLPLPPPLEATVQHRAAPHGMKWALMR